MARRWKDGVVLSICTSITCQMKQEQLSAWKYANETQGLHNNYVILTKP